MATTKADGELTEKQEERIKKFLHLYSGVEIELKDCLNLKRSDLSGFSSLVDRYLKKNPLWLDSARQLSLTADIRNLLTHHRNARHGFPFAVTQRSVNVLEGIRDHLSTPVTVAKRFRKKVNCVSADDSLAHVTAMAFEKGYSQFPVLASERFSGLITENEITRWLGRRATNGSAVVKLDEVSVRTVIREKEPFRKGIPIFRFAQMDSPIDEVMGLFMTRPMLEVVLLTKSGNRKEEIEGIITQWDAARYPN